MIKGLFNAVKSSIFGSGQAAQIIPVPSPRQQSQPEIVAVFPHSFPFVGVDKVQSIEVIAACRAGDLGRVRALVSAEPSLVNATEYLPADRVAGSMTVHSGDGIDCMTATQACVLNGHVDILRLLVERGAAIAPATVITAASNGDTQALQILLPHFKRDSDSAVSLTIETQALIAACRKGHRDAANFLLDEGAWIAGVTGHYRTGSALRAAMMTSNTDLVRDLLSRGANPLAFDVVDAEGYRDVNPDAVELIRAAQRRSPQIPPPRLH